MHFYRYILPWMAPYLTIVAKLTVLGFYWGPETEYKVHFSHEPIYSASWSFPTTIRDVDLVCLWQIFWWGDVVMLPSPQKSPKSNWRVGFIPGYNTSQIFDQSTVTAHHFGENWTRNTLVNSECRKIVINTSRAELMALNAELKTVHHASFTLHNIQAV